MPRPRHARSRVQVRTLLVAAVMGVAIAAAACGLVYEVAAAPPPSGTASVDAMSLSSGPVRERPLADAPNGRTPTAPHEPASAAQGRSSLPQHDTAGPEAAPTGSAAAMTMFAADPVRLRIPAIGVDTELVDLGLETDGTLEVPSEGFPAGWYTGAPTPGELGPAIIAGHVDWGGRPGVFFDLRDLAAGDAIAVTRQDGSKARFRVTRVDQFAKDAFPTGAVYGDLDHAGLRLITCGGSFDPRARSYDDNLVVFAELVAGDAADTLDLGRGRP